MTRFFQNKAAVIGAAVFILLALGAGFFLFTSTKTFEATDFRGTSWGSDAKTIPGMVLLAEEGPLTFYERANEDLQFEGVKLDRIVYGFYKDRFYQALAYYRSASDYEQLKASFSRRYGDPVQPEPSAKKLVWNSDQVNLVLSFDESKGGRVTYLYKPIHNEVELNS